MTADDTGDVRAGDKIEILSEALIDEQLPLVSEILATCARLGVMLGWHYILDLSWLLRELEVSPPATVLDAGAGWGVMQFLLADRGYTVLSADMEVREPRTQDQRLYRFRSMGSSQAINHDYLKHHGRGLRPGSRLASAVGGVLNTPIRDLPGRVAKRLRGESLGDRAQPGPSPPPDRPEITFYRCDLSDMGDLADNSVDAVVSVSALEHNPADKVRGIVEELNRVTRPGGRILVTASGTQQGAMFHEASHSYLLDEAGLREAYGLSSPESNYGDVGALWEALKNPRYLHRWLARFYYDGDRNGMPWGVWAPEYLPVGIRRIARG